MGKRVSTRAYRTRFSGFWSLRLPVLCVFFVVGVVLGYVLSRLLGGAEDLALQIQNYALRADDTTSASLLSLLDLYLRYPLLILVFGYCSFGVVMLPLLLSAQGFTFSFATAALAAALGRKGILVALVAFGLRSILSIFSTLLLTMFVLDRVAGNSEGNVRKNSKGIVLSFFLLAVGIILEVTVVPRILIPVLNTLKL